MNKQYSDVFAENAEKLMKAKGISKNEMARKLNVAPSTMCGYVNKDRAWPLDKAVECADMLARDINFMLGRAEL